MGIVGGNADSLWVEHSDYPRVRVGVGLPPFITTHSRVRELHKLATGLRTGIPAAILPSGLLGFQLHLARTGLALNLMWVCHLLPTQPYRTSLVFSMGD